MFFSPKSDRFYRDALAEGFARPGARHTLDDFEVPAFVPVVPDDDLEAAADMVRPSLALYIGGMGAKSANFHADVFSRMGYQADVEKIQDLYLAGNKKDAIAAVPLALVEDVALIGPPAKIRDELPVWEQTLITTLLLQAPPQALRFVVEALG
jgi:alkanesulfonate monooxygenase SsuD/methylene tetrahydromethanopterin reductase-like flavin-dependent oxidoreductase (luciferase family)